MVCDVIEQMEKKSGISYRLVICILKQDCVCVCVCVCTAHMHKILLPILTEDQVERKVIMARLFEWSMQEPDFLSKNITGDESLVFVCDPQMKCQSFRWYTNISLGKKKFWVPESEQKVFPIAFFNSLVVVHHKFVCVGHTEVFD